MVTGVDISPIQIERARRLVPAAGFICRDMSEVEFQPQSFGAIVSFFAITHVPVAEQQRMLRKLSRWLRPGGYLLATVGTRAWTGTEDNWHGAPMFTGAMPTERPTSPGSKKPDSRFSGRDSFPKEQADIPSFWPR
jgi:cyclopropane fatty-acyl-phospholipid synthase-like methyltransferase